MIRAFSCILNYQAQCFKALSLKLFLFLKALSFSLFYFKVRFFSWNDRIQRLELMRVCILRRILNPDNCLLKNILKKSLFSFQILSPRRETKWF